MVLDLLKITLVHLRVKVLLAEAVGSISSSLSQASGRFFFQQRGSTVRKAHSVSAAKLCPLEEDAGRAL